MYTVFHTGIFYDGRESTYCRPVFYKVIHQVPGLKGPSHTSDGRCMTSVSPS